MYKEHDLFVPPPHDAALWRYLDFTKFVSLLDKQSLFFSRADKLGDPFEGSYSKMNLQMRPLIYKDQIPDHALQQLSEFVKQSRRFTMINCWHRSAYESAAMWRLYAREHDGVAIKTNFQSLSDSLQGSKDVFIGSVSYIDYDLEFIREDNSMAPFLNKRRSFEHENEVRAIMHEIPSNEHGIDLSRDICEVGMYHEVEIKTLVHEVVVSPFSPEWFSELVQSVAVRYDLAAPVRKSSLAETPVWG